MINTNKTFDSLLVLQCQSGNKKAAAILVKRWHVKLCKHANWYVKDEHFSKDIVQDCWNIIFLKISKLKNTNSFGSWALSIVTRKSIDWLRKNKKEKELLDTYKKRLDHVSVIDETIDETEVIKVLLKKAINMLPEQQKMVLNLFYKEEYSIKEISDIIGISKGTVKSRLFTAREKLKLILKNKNYEY
ncbi:RNA polymerase sigma factor [Aquimarina litoralis]|uniref:RNA polymerase sigma factor n=1 Tax=Aquimarina litoralis TaxID=584605 RepID=UPI001C5713AA|nr:sigma-70 family RNA polymerase sigma factor [Aquimarina litoralis]MBW1296798.1 sigma-70 family RNA polymerase sigma factor [Aquimarina litoralis]